MGIHPTAVIDAGARLGNVDVGPYAVIGAGVELADGVEVGSHALLQGRTVVGARTRIHAHVVLGGDPQDTKHDRAAPTRLVVGADCVIREFVTMHRGSSQGEGITRVGDRSYFMANSHVAHDCTVGYDVMFANSVALGGHVVVGDGAVLGGLAAVHQHARIGRLAMLGGGAMCAQDVPPFTLAQGDRARLYGLNVIGMKRAGLDGTRTAALKEAWRTLFAADLPRRTAAEDVATRLGHVAEVEELLAFVASSTRGLCRTAAT
jgi:UDP-N-acetylglucosamine acyltransferase